MDENIMSIFLEDIGLNPNPVEDIALLDRLRNVYIEGKNPTLMYKGHLTTNKEELEDDERKTYVFFFGIPYATAPLENLRFKVFCTFLEFLRDNRPIVLSSNVQCMQKLSNR